MFFNLLTPHIGESTLEQLSDEIVVEKYVITQNSGYFDCLYSRYARKVYGKCLSMLKSEARAEDAVQEIFVKILLNISKFSGRSKFSTWLYSITYNFCIDAIRKDKKKIGVLVDDINVLGDSLEEEIDDSAILEINVGRLKHVLEEIPEGDKAVLLMKYLEEFSIKDICEIVDKSESAVKMQIKRAKEKFMKVYDELYKTTQ